MKTNKQLLQIILTDGDKNFKNESNYGICGFSTSLVRCGEINATECHKIKKYIKTHRPKPGDKHYRPSHKNSPYYWATGAWKPRRKWLKDQIKNM